MKSGEQINLDNEARNELVIEGAIISDKQRFGRVRNSMMKHLGAEYWEEIANRVLARINKRASKGSKEMKDSLSRFHL